MIRIVVLITVFYSLQAFAQDFSLVPYRNGGDWGFCDAQKKIVIKPQFERTYWFAENGLARVKSKGKYGFIDKKGKFIIEPRFDEAFDFFFEGAMVVINNKRYCLDSKGNTTETKSKEPFECSGLSSGSGGESICSNCCKPFKVGGKFGMVCKNYEYLKNKFTVTSMDSIPAIYDTIYTSVAYSADFTPLIAKKNNKYGLVSNKNKKIFPFEFDSINIIDYYVFMLKKDGIWHLSNTNSPTFENIEAWNSFLFASGYYLTIQVNKKWGVIYSDGKILLPLNFEEIILPTRYIIEREFAIKLNGKYGFISDKSQIPPIYDSLVPFDGYKYTMVRKDGKEGYINLAGEEFFEN